MLVLVAVVLFICCLLPAFLRWKKQQRILKEKLLSRLSKRSERLLYSLEMVSDRYLTAETNVFFFEYLLDVVGQLTNANFQSSFVLKKAYLEHTLSDFKSKQHILSKDRVGNQEQLDQIHGALQCILREVRNIPENYGASRAIIRHHIALARYAHALAYHDLLVKQASMDMDNNKKGQALEKYRIALSIMEKNASVAQSKREMTRLKSKIQDVESVLFAKKEKPESELK